MRLHTLLALAALIALAAAPRAAPGQPAAIPTPSEYFGFEIGADGELARYPDVLDYLQLLAERSHRVAYEPRGTTTDGNPYVLVKLSAKENLDRLDRLVAINHRLADPRGLSDEDARALAREGVPFYFLYATIHSTEVGNGLTLINIAHRLATEESPEIREILDNTVVLLVPSQNPDGQILVVDHWYETRGTGYARVYPDLYHRYTGHDDNRDWFMFTQKGDAARHRRPPGVTDRRSPTTCTRWGAAGARMFVPPFRDPHDPNIHPILLEGQAQIRARDAVGADRRGAEGDYLGRTSTTSGRRRASIMVYHGQPRILTEIASANLADPYVNPAGPSRPLGRRRPARTSPCRTTSGIWRIRDIVEYGEIATFAALESMAKYRTRWLEHFYRVHRDWVNRDEAPYAFVVPAGQRDPFATYELLEILEFGEVEIHRAREPFTAGGTRYAVGSWVVPLAQPYGAFAKTMLERQVYPDLRRYPGGPPIPPYDVTGHTLGLLMGGRRSTASTSLSTPASTWRGFDEVGPARTLMPLRPGWPMRSARSRTPGSWRRRACRRPACRSTALRRASRQRAGNGRPGPGWFRRHRKRTRILDRTAAEDRLARPRPRRCSGRGRPPAEGHDAHRPVAGCQQHARRVDALALRAVRTQPRSRLRAGLRRRPGGPVRPSSCSRPAPPGRRSSRG